MKALITKEFAEKKVITPLKDQFKIGLVGSLSKNSNGFEDSYNDIDIVMFYRTTEEILAFKQSLMKLGWAQAEVDTLRRGNDTGELWYLKVEPKMSSQVNPMISRVPTLDVVLDVYYEQWLGGETANDNRFK